MSPDVASGDDAAATEQLLDDLSRLRLDPHRPSMRYRAQLAAVAVAMALLPLLYFAFVGLFAYWIYGRLADPPTLANVWGCLAYALLLVAGPVTVLFLIKPWFARRGEEPMALPLHRGEAPDLECFVGLLARAVGAPGPKRIELDCGVNASAGFRGGWRGVLDGELKLTLGLPLVAGLDMRSFAGVLAHELGHFSQKVGIRLAWVITQVNERLELLVRARDRWDLALQNAARGERAVVQLFAIATLGLLWLARRPLWLLMWLGRGISCVALRQMEFDADGYEIVFAGSGTFRKTSRDIHMLNLGSSQALRLIGETIPEGRLPRNLPLLARVQAENLPPRVREAVEEELCEGSARATLFSSHPRDCDRIEVAESWGAPGLIRCRLAARALFRDFDATAERLTVEFYGREIDLDLEACRLVDNARFARVVDDREQRFEACERFFDSRFTLARPLNFLPEEIATMARGAAAADDTLRGNARAMRSWLSDNAEVFESYEAAEEEVVRIARAAELYQAGFRIRGNAIGLPRSRRELSERQKAAADRRDQALVQLGDFDRIARRRIVSAVARHLATPDKDAETRRVLHALDKLGGVLPTMMRLRRRVLAQAALLQNLSPTATGRTVVGRLQRNAAAMSDLVAVLREATEAVRYPFSHGAGKVSVADYASAEFPDYQAVLRSFKTSEALLERLFDLYFRLVGHLCLIVEEVEAKDH